MDGAMEVGMDAAGRTDAEHTDIFGVAVDDIFYVLNVFRI